MKVGKAIKKVEKYLGVKVQYDGCRYWWEYEGEIGSFLANGYGGPGMSAEAMEADACNWHRRSKNDHSDSMTDYFAGSFRDNLTQVLHSMKAPPPKFPAGSLVRGKSNKRATRCGYAGKVGLVIETGDYCKIQWVGQPADLDRYGNPRGPQSYPSRDLEVVS